jgi:hypothetical protein
MPKKNKKTKKLSKKKIGAFYKVNFWIIALASILLFYFAILVPAGPKSIPFITQKIEEKLIAALGPESSINDSSISFTSYGRLKVAIGGLNIFYSHQDEDKKEFFTIPRLEAEFPLFNFLFLDFQPEKIKIIKPLIVVNDIKNLTSSKSGVLEGEEQLSAITSLLAAIKKGDNPIENIEIEDAKLVVFSGNLRTDIILKRSQIKASKKGGALIISSENQITFNESKKDVSLDSSCLVSESNGLRCDLFLNNFSPDSISNIHPKLADLGKISATFNSQISLGFKEGEFSNTLFKITSNGGNLKLLNLFAEDLAFQNFSAAGEYDNKLKTLNISSIESDVISNLSDNSSDKNPHVSMSAVFSDFSKELRTSKFNIKLQNILTNELERFWPKSLGKKTVRSWVVKYLRDGLIDEAQVSFAVNHGGENSGLDYIFSELAFSGVNLAYSPSFPKISNISAVANFSKNDMQIHISKGDVLKSKLSKTLIEIKDFHAQENILYISGNLKGKAGDALKHAGNNPKFLSAIDQYLNGEAISELDVRLNLANKITLKNSYISVESLMSNVKNKFARGPVLMKSKKDFNSKSFVTNFDLTSTEILAKEFDVIKKPNSESELNFIVKIGDKNDISIEKILLTANQNRSKLSGEIDFLTSPFSIKKIIIKNENFGRNNFTATYRQKKGLNQIFVKGSKINLSSLIQNNFHKKFEGNDKRSSYVKVRIYLPRVELLEKKFLNHFSLALNCSGGLCFSGLVQGSYLDKESIDLTISKKGEDDFSTIAGKISEIGYLAEGFGISNIVAGGNAKINIKNSSNDNGPVLDGDIMVDKPITIYENATVKRLAKNNLFFKIKDKIFSSEKTTFDSVKIKFNFKSDILTLNSLIANNYKIGITATGFLNLTDSTYELRGKVIPGFLINNLFGIGNIPLIGNVISGILTGGEGGGLFGIRYEYVKTKKDKEGQFSTNVISSFVPTTIKNLFDFK